MTVARAKDEVWPGMPRAELKRAGKYIRALADGLGLRDWRFELEHVWTDGEDSFASIRPTPGRRIANIRLCKDWCEVKDEEKRMILIHELVHCHIDPAAEIVRRAATQLGTQAYEPIWEAFNLLVEHAVDGIADAIDEMFPPYPKGGPCGRAPSRTTRKRRTRTPTKR